MKTKAEIVTISGHWVDEPATTYIVRVSLGSWDEQEDARDSQIFYYTDGEPLKVGDVIASDFVVTEIY